MDDKMRHKGEEAKGKIKETAGDVTDDPQRRTEGQTEQDKAKGKQGLDDLTDKAKDAKDKVSDRARDLMDRDR